MSNLHLYDYVSSSCEMSYCLARLKFFCWLCTIEIVLLQNTKWLQNPKSKIIQNNLKSKIQNTKQIQNGFKIN